MNCKKIQRLLLTDYLDGELDRGTLGHIKQHMDSCAHCKAVEQKLQEVRAPFKKAKHINPPARIWQCICERITAEQILPEGSLFECLVERLREFLFIRRQPVFATATITLTIIIFALIFIHIPVQRQIETDAWNVVAKDIGFWIDEKDGAIYDFGTDIEEYFL